MLRGLSIRFSTPTQEELILILQKVAKQEKYIPPDDICKQIAKKCDMNLRRALLMLQASSQHAKNEIKQPDWILHIERIADEILRQQSIQKLQSVRGMFYELITHNIPTNIIFKTLLSKLMEKCDISLQEKVVSFAGEYERRPRQDKQIFQKPSPFYLAKPTKEFSHY